MFIFSLADARFRPQVASVSQRRVKRLAELRRRDITDPLLQDVTLRIQQEEMRLSAIMQHSLESVRGRVIDIQINEIDPSCVFFLNALHYRRHRQAGPAPESEKFDQLRLTGR